MLGQRVRAAVVDLRGHGDGAAAEGPGAPRWLPADQPRRKESAHVVEVDPAAERGPSRCRSSQSPRPTSRRGGPRAAAARHGPASAWTLAQAGAERVARSASRGWGSGSRAAARTPGPWPGGRPSPSQAGASSVLACATTSAKRASAWCGCSRTIGARRSLPFRTRRVCWLSLPRPARSAAFGSCGGSSANPSSATAVARAGRTPGSPSPAPARGRRRRRRRRRAPPTPTGGGPGSRPPPCSARSPWSRPPASDRAGRQASAVSAG